MEVMQLSYEGKFNKTKLVVEADAYTAIATIDKLSEYFDKGHISETNYRRQLRACLNEIYIVRDGYEGLGFDFNDFIKKELIDVKFPRGMSKLEMLEGLPANETIKEKSQTDAELGTKTADFVAATIEIMDLTKMKSVAVMKFLISLLDEIIPILKEFPKFGGGYWSLVQAEEWRTKLLKENPEDLMNERECDQLSLDASRWLADFRRNLKEL